MRVCEERRGMHTSERKSNGEVLAFVALATASRQIETIIAESERPTILKMAASATCKTKKARQKQRETYNRDERVLKFANIKTI